jgi:threonine aldolase
MNSTPVKKSFASDNYSGIHPDILQAIVQVNVGHMPAYGQDEITAQAVEKFKEHFGDDIDVYFVFNGTAANTLTIATLAQSYNAVICADTAHINAHECGAPEKFSGCKLLTIKTADGKLTVDRIEQLLEGIGDQHVVQPKIISITQLSELGTIYTADEIRALTHFAHEQGMFVHVDGARISNAAAFLGLSLKEITRDLGIDVLSFGGTKNGMMFGEAVIFFNPALSKEFKYLRKQGMQLASKMRFISAQFIALLSNDLWRKNAKHSNNMAQLLAQEIRALRSPKVTIVQPVEGNGVFAHVEPSLIPLLRKEYAFYMWDEKESIVRWMTSFDITPEDIYGFIQCIKKVL